MWKKIVIDSVVVQPPSHIDSATPRTAAHQASLSLSISCSLPKFIFIALVMLSGQPILWSPLLLLPSIFPSTGKFSNESSVSIRWPKYWNFSFRISPSSDSAGSISLKTEWTHLLAVQETISFLQHHTLKASILQHSASFTIQISKWYVALGRPQLFTIRTFVGKVVSAFQHTVLGLSLLSCKEAITFFFMAAVTIHSDFGAREEEICHCFHHFPLYLPLSKGARCHDLSVFVCLFVCF